MSEEGVLRIIELQAENVKRIKAVRLKPDGTMVRIEGRNGAGKSSVLDAVCAALGGAKWNPDRPVRKGEKKASVTLDIGEFVIERTWTATGGGGLKVSTKDGKPVPSPQTVLGTLADDLLFDPVAFERMKPTEQAELLRRIAGLDFSNIDAERSTIYQERTIANREAKNAEARIGPMPAKPKSDTPIDVRALADKQEEIIRHNRDCDNAVAAMERAIAAVDAAKRAVHVAQERLNAAESMLKEAKKTSDSRQRKEESDLGGEIINAEINNRLIRDRAEWEKRKDESSKLSKVAEKLDERIKQIDTEKERMLSAAKFPLDAMSIDEFGPTLNGVPFAQASSAERLRAAVAIGLNSKKRLRVLFIRDGSLLDSASLAELHRVVESFEAQVFVERVAEGPEAGAVYIEDGEIVEALA